MVGPCGLEPQTSTVSRWRSSQLSYGPSAAESISWTIRILPHFRLGAQFGSPRPDFSGRYRIKGLPLHLGPDVSIPLRHACCCTRGPSENVCHDGNGRALFQQLGSCLKSWKRKPSRPASRQALLQAVRRLAMGRSGAIRPFSQAGKTKWSGLRPGKREAHISRAAMQAESVEQDGPCRPPSCSRPP